MRTSLAAVLVLVSACTAPGGTGSSSTGSTTVGSSYSGTVCDLQYATQDVFNGIFAALPTPTGEPSPAQRLAALQPAYWRVNSNTDGGPIGLSLPFPEPYDSGDGRHIPQWDFGHQASLLTEAPPAVPKLLAVDSPPDVLFTGTGRLGPNAASRGTTAGQGTLRDGSYRELATYLADLVRYYNTPIAVSAEGSAATFGPDQVTDPGADLSAVAAGFSLTTAATNGPGWQTAAVVANLGPHGVRVAGWPRGTPRPGSSYTIAAAAPVSGATPWPRPFGAGPITYWEVMNEPDLGNSFLPRSSPAVLPPEPVLTPASSGHLNPANTHVRVSYRLTAIGIGATESAPGREVSIVLGPGEHGVHLGWAPTSNLGLAPAAYGIYGRDGGGEHALVVVGRDAAGGLQWSDDGSVTPTGGFTGGGLPAADDTLGYQLLRPHEYRRMWDVVVPAMKAVDPSIKVIGPTVSNPTSLAHRDVVTSVVTRGPSDRSWVSDRDYVDVLMDHPSSPPDVVSVHGYGGFRGSADSDQEMLSGGPGGGGLDGLLREYATSVKPYVGATPVWQTEIGPQAGNFDKPDVRGITQFASAWLAAAFARVCREAPFVRSLFQFEFAISNTYSLVSPLDAPSSCPAEPACRGIRAGRPLLAYWTLLELNRAFPRGSRLLPARGAPDGVLLLAAAQPPDFHKVSVLVVNTRTGDARGEGTPASVSVDVAALGLTDIRESVIDAETDPAKGPRAVPVTAGRELQMTLGGYAVTLIEGRR